MGLGGCVISSRKRYTEEFKREAVQMTKAAGVTARQVAHELGINPNVLSRWGRELASSGEKAFEGPGKARDEETAALKRELARVKKERDFEAPASRSARASLTRRFRDEQVSST